ncbi:hypothetical protein Paes_1206 [Prosthecochloris aestuarii DSM 271]|uniref:Uncharacterized protein n=1 Tax=Prosthecochloris aestuarii (strain DSM 271 / SK 413) TaxID=290512 RepID=B4S848_PROA2|nr:hypothetical protein [Prosthecochloris aestuarii]ACF46235.1 hypothetical protein Paes_1206 [Prosthecochloris aestuarii DSM 271]
MKRALLWLLIPLFLYGAAPLDKRLYEEFFSSQSAKQNATDSPERDEEQLMLFGPDMEKDKTPNDHRKNAGKEDTADEKDSPLLLAWTGAGSPGQQSLFSFSDKVSIEGTRRDLVWWFRLTTQSDPPFALWQIAERPFPKSINRWDDTGLVLASGPVVNQAGLGAGKLFQIDLSQYLPPLQTSSSPQQKAYYVRVVSLDWRARPIWPASNTIVLYYGTFSPR